MRKKSRKLQALACAVCEQLEERRLLFAFQLFVDGNLVPAPGQVDFGTVALGSPEPSHTFTLKSLDAKPYTISASLHLGEFQDFTRSGDSGNKVLSNGDSYTVTYRMATNRPTPRLRELNFRYTEPGGDNGTKTFTLVGNILPSQVNITEDFGSLKSETRQSSGNISAIKRVDGEANTLQQVSSYLGAFELSSASNRVDLSATGKSVGDGSFSTTGTLAITLVRDTNVDGKLSIAERENPIASMTTNTITQSQPQTQSTTRTLTSGRYLVFISAGDITNAGFGDNGSIPRELRYEMSLKVTEIAAPAFNVRDVKSGAVINNNDATPSTSDGTSFGEVDAGQSPTLTFSVKNAGEATLNVDGQRPNVSGDFVVSEGLNSTIAGGASDTFQVKLINTAPGQKSGTITIQSSNAQGGNFTFSIGGLVKNATPAPPTFAVLNNGKLTVTGTSGNDALTSTVSGGSSFRFTLNGVDSTSFVSADVTKIVIDLLDGNDNYSSATQLDIKQTINGGNGNDFLRGGKQADGLFGNEGDDRMDGRTRGDLFDGGAGSDTAIYRQRRATEPVTVTIDETANDGGSSDQSKDNVLSSTEHIQGGLGDDNLTGSSKTNRLFGFEGNDTLNGLKGNDTLDGGAGENQINGGFGNDSIFSRNTFGDVIDGGADTDSLVGDLLDDIANVENPNLA